MGWGNACDDYLELSFFPTAPVAPKALKFQSNSSSSSLIASWASMEGAEWLHFTLQNLRTPAESTRVSIKNGLSNYTFQHLQPGTPYRLEVSAAVGPYRVEAGNITAYTREYGGRYCMWHLNTNRAYVGICMML